MGTIQTNIKAIRNKLGYTQEVVADVLGIARPTYTEYETKDIDIPFDTLRNSATSLESNLHLFLLKMRTN